MVITLVDVPGSPFFPLKDETPKALLGESRTHSLAAKLRGVLADLIMGYDIFTVTIPQKI